MNILDKPVCLCLNAGWSPIGTRSVREAILAMTANPSEKDRAAVGLNIEYRQRDDGTYDFSQPLAMIPVAWEDWVKLPIREFDEVLHSAKMTIRVPHVILAKNFHKMPLKKFRLSKKTIYDREQGRCAYTGKKLSLSGSTLDHVVSRDEWRRRGLEGSPDRFTNVVLCDPKVNFDKSNKPLKETNLKLRIVPKEPNPVPVVALITEARDTDWKWFVAKQQK